jgi:predicted nuclease of restriction endonuclease-like (RecB) superfamily
MYEYGKGRKDFMSDIVKMDDNYKNWIADLRGRYRASQIKAASSVNREMLMFYWSLGRDIEKMEAVSRWGSGFYEGLSKDLRNVIPDAKGFSPVNLRYMQKFYCLYVGKKFPQSVEELSDRTDETNFPQVVERLGVDIFAIPWGHHRTIIDKCKDVDKALFFVRKTIENNWSRAVLLNFLDTNLYERQGKAISNFDKTLPEPQSDLAQEMTKDPYNFDFLTIQEGFYEKELKAALMDSIQSFLLELGTGFAFVGREYRLVVGNTEQFIDMLFYNITLHCYVVIEIKIRDFEPGDMGQISTYVAAVDGILRKEGDERTIGLLICKTKDNVLAQYAVNNITAPIGISEFELSKIVPEDFKGTLPTIEEIERELK